MTSEPLPALVTADELATSLGVDTPQDESALRGVWDSALQDASDDLRDAIGQPISPATTTIKVSLNELGFALIPLSPVRSVDSVTDDNGNVLDPSTYRNDGQRLYVDWAGRALSIPPLAPEDRFFTVTVQHGWTVVPGKILTWVRMLAAAQIQQAAGGNLGINGGATSVAIDDGKVTYASSGDGIPDKQVQRLKAMYGGEQ